MRKSPRFLTWICASAALLAALLAALPAHGQVIRGALRSQATARAVERARVTAVDSAGRVVGETIADDSGKFILRVDARGVPFTLTVRRIGIEPSSTPEFELTPTDTMDYELSIPETPVLGDTVRITGMASYNESKFQEAVRRGWKVFPPAEVAKHRDRVNNVYDLLRWADASLIIPSRRNECVRSARYLAGDRRMDRCMVWIVDGVVLGPLPLLNPADTYFLAVLTASQSAVQFGERAPWGAIVLYTRMKGDKLHP